MKTILLSVLFASLVTGVITALGAGSGFEKYLHYFCALLLTLALLSPLSALTKEDFSLPDLFPEWEENQPEKVPESFLRQFETQIEEAVSKLLESEFSLAKNACRPIAKAEDREGMPTLVRVQVRLYTLRGAALTAKIRTRLKEACGCEIEILEDVRI